jgi:tRNA threonylcarbamoyladenosine biosynthesis protein TsaE
MQVFEWISNGPEETFSFAENMSPLLQENDIILLEGDLGAGKTTFTKGIASGLGIRKTVSSPTFTIIKEYHGRIPLYHMDVYRLKDSYEDLGFDEYFEGGGVTIVEWSKLIQEQLPSEHLKINIYRHGDQVRKFELKPKGMRYESLCKELFK